MKKINTDSFINKANIKHNFKYNYSKVNYLNSQTKITIICSIHGEFMQRPDMHLNRGDGCRLCKVNSMYSNTEKFIINAIKKHENKYIYENVLYKSVYDKIEIICRSHGSFSQTPNAHLKGFGCNKCCVNGKLDNDEFINRCQKSHNYRYLYDSTIYVNSRTKIEIKCMQHGLFKCYPNNHLLRKSGCPICEKSKGEIAIEDFLKSKKVKYESQFKFDDLKFKRHLKFDFCILKNDKIKLLIEFNGKQHYEYNDFMHKGLDKFSELKLRDQMKINYCMEKNINLLIIRYDDNIQEKLNQII